MSIRQEIIAVLRERLEGITTLAGYQTNVGRNVFTGERVTLGPDDEDAWCSIVVGESANTHNMMNIGPDLPIEIHVCTKEVDSAWETIEALIADVEKAIEIDVDLGLGKRKVHDMKHDGVRPLEREDGSEYVGAAVSYTVSYTRAWGTP